MAMRPTINRPLARISFPLPKSPSANSGHRLSQGGRGTLKDNMFDLAPLLPAWEKGLGDEGDSCKRSNEKIHQHIAI
jgi:hypothetical protein